MPQLKELMLEFTGKISRFAQPRVFKSQFKLKCSLLDGKKQKPLADNEPLRFAYYYTKAFLKQRSLQESKKSKVNKLKPSKPLDEYAPHLHAFHKQILSKGLTTEKPPLVYEQFKLLKLLMDCQSQLPQLSDIDGSYNMWIVKPSYNARGVGIYCTNQLSEILQSNKKEHTAQQKVVQKYIETPMLLHNAQF